MIHRILPIILLSLLAVACAVAPEPQSRDGTAGATPALAESGAMCGGVAGVQCADGQWCDYPDDSACGYGDGSGICRPRPEACTMQYDPVCGCDAITYGNACQASAAGVDVTMKGECAMKSNVR